MKSTYYLTITVDDRIYLFDPDKYSSAQLREVYGREYYSGQLCACDLPMVTKRPIHAEIIYGRYSKPYIYS